MTNTLLVPIHLDALYLCTDTSVMEEMTDYSKLPYRARAGNVINRDYAYLSETVLSPPFENLNLTLKAGIHLHWAMPDALTNGLAQADGITFPLVPNRWLIVRRGGNKPEKQWVVESDYLYPEGSTPHDAINILYQRGLPGESQPFRFLGRKLELSEWRSRTGATNSQYVRELTAIGPFAKVDNFSRAKTYERMGVSADVSESYHLRSPDKQIKAPLSERLIPPGFGQVERIDSMIDAARLLKNFSLY